jgi:hypothetical protein
MTTELKYGIEFSEILAKIVDYTIIDTSQYTYIKSHAIVTLSNGVRISLKNLSMWPYNIIEIETDNCFLTWCPDSLDEIQTLLNMHNILEISKSQTSLYKLVHFLFDLFHLLANKNTLENSFSNLNLNIDSLSYTDIQYQSMDY